MQESGNVRGFGRKKGKRGGMEKGQEDTREGREGGWESLRRRRGGKKEEKGRRIMGRGRDLRRGEDG